MYYSSTLLRIDDIFAVFTFAYFMFLPPLFPLFMLFLHVDLPFIFWSYLFELFIIFIAYRFSLYETVRINLIIFLHWYGFLIAGLPSWIILCTFLLLVFGIIYVPVALIEYFRAE